MFKWHHKTISRECQNHVESRKLGEPSLDTRLLPPQGLVLFLRVFVLKELNAGTGVVWYRDQGKPGDDLATQSANRQEGTSIHIVRGDAKQGVVQLRSQLGINFVIEYGGSTLVSNSSFAGWWVWCALASSPGLSLHVGRGLGTRLGAPCTATYILVTILSNISFRCSVIPFHVPCFIDSP